MVPLPCNTGFQRNDNMLLVHVGEGIIFTLALTQRTTPYPARMIDGVLAKPNGRSTLISLHRLPSAPTCGYTDERRASRKELHCDCAASSGRRKHEGSTDNVTAALLVLSEHQTYPDSFYIRLR